MDEPSTTEQIQSCTQYLLDRFNYDKRMAQVTEQISMTPDALDEALVRFLNGDILSLRLTLENAAKEICERSAKTLVAGYGDNWQAQLEGYFDGVN